MAILMRGVIIAAAMIMPSLGFSHGDDNHEPAEPVPDRTIEVEFFEDVIMPIVQENCLGCHNSKAAAGGHSFETALEIKSHADLIFDAVLNLRMPKERPEWRESLDAKVLLYWASKEESGTHEH